MPFARKMPKVSLRSFFSIFNIFGMTSVTFNVNELKPSRIFSVINLLRMPIVLTLTLIYGLNIKLRNITLKQDVTDLKTFSALTEMTIIISGQILIITVFFVSLLNFFRNQDISKFFNFMSQIDFDDAHLISLQKRWRQNLILMTIFFIIISGFQFYTKMKVRLISLAIYPIVAYPYLGMTVFLSFLKAFEIFFATLMSNFRCSLEISRRKVNFEIEDYQNLKIKYNEIYELNKMFHNVFGAQITAITICIITMTTLHVTQ